MKEFSTRLLVLASVATALATRAPAALPGPADAPPEGRASASATARFASFSYAPSVQAPGAGVKDTQSAWSDPDRKRDTPDLRAVPQAPAAPTAASIQKMPAYRVTEPRVYLFRDRDLYTKRGMAALAFREHPGLLIGKPFHLNDAEAYQTFLRDDWRRTKSDYFDLAHAMAQGGDRQEGRMILEEINDLDLRMRAEGFQNTASPESNRYQTAHPEGGPRVADLAEVPLNIPFVRKDW
jgi:hypothetical protein